MAGCEPIRGVVTPGVVPEVGPGELGTPTPLGASAVTRYGVVLPYLTTELDGPEVAEAELMWENVREAVAEVWSRGFNYDSLGEGHYEDTDI